MKLQLLKISLYIFMMFMMSTTMHSQDNLVSIKYIYFNESNIDEITNMNENVLIYFTANWSADSQNKKQNFLNIKNGLLEIKSKDNRENFIIVGEVNSKSNKICRKYEISKFPTIILISGDKHYKYKGEIETEHILHWLKKYIVNNIVSLLRKRLNLKIMRLLMQL